MVAAHRPRPRFAQHFLVARGVVEAIAGLVRPAAGEVVVEIGPGRGALTEELLALVDRLVAVEIDRDLAALLRTRPDADRLDLIEGDILQVDLGEVLRAAGGGRLSSAGAPAEGRDRGSSR